MPAGAGTMCCPISADPRAASAATTALHGGGGEWKVARQRLRWDILEAFRDAAEEIGIPRRDDFNDGDNEGSGYFEVNQRERHPLDRGEGLPAAGAAAAQPAGRDRRARHRADLRRQAGQRRALSRGRRRAGRHGGGRGDPRGRGDQLAEAARALGHRRSRRARATWHRRAPRAHRGRREPAGSPADPHGLPRHRRPHAQPARQQRCRQGGDGRRIRALPPRAAVDGAEPARHLLPQRRDRGDAPTSNTTSSRSRPTSSATRSTPTLR